ncbi:MAG: hypothetical protein LBV27_05440 [Oscillospiraceae bacterium]|nr:hypothetical protein [Oscillospiraceae bacterium]
MRGRKRSLTQKFIISHMIVLTLVFAVTGFFYFTTSTKLTREETILTATNIIDDGRKAVDGKVEALLNLNLPLTTGDNVRALARMARPFPMDSHIELNSARERLSVYAMMNDFASGLTLYFKNNNLFISDRSVGVYSKAYYDTAMSYSDIPYNEWQEIVNAENQYRVISNYGSGKQETVDIIHDLPTFSKTTAIAMIISVDGRAFDGVFESLQQYEGCYYFVMGSNGELYYSNADYASAQNLMARAGTDNGKYLVFHSRSEIIGLEYTAFIPQKALYSREYRFIGNFVLVYLLLMFFSFVLFIYMSYENVKPLKLVMGKIAESQGILINKNDNEAEFIGTAFADLIYGTENLTMIIQENFLSKLLNGAMFTESEVHMANIHLGEIFDYDQYQVAVLKIMEFAETQSSEEYVLVSAMQKVATDRIAALLPDHVFAHRLDYDKIALIFCLPADAPRYAAADTLRQCVSDLEKIKIHVICAVGDAKKLSDQIYISCQNACWLLETVDISADQAIYWPSAQPAEYDSFYYPPESLFYRRPLQ